MAISIDGNEFTHKIGGNQITTVSALLDALETDIDGLPGYSAIQSYLTPNMLTIERASGEDFVVSHSGEQSTVAIVEATSVTYTDGEIEKDNTFAIDFSFLDLIDSTSAENYGVWVVIKNASDNIIFEAKEVNPDKLLEELTGSYPKAKMSGKKLFISVPSGHSVLAGYRHPENSLEYVLSLNGEEDEVVLSPTEDSNDNTESTSTNGLYSSSPLLLDYPESNVSVTRKPIDIYVSDGQMEEAPYYTFTDKDDNAVTQLKQHTTYIFRRLEEATDHPFAIDHASATYSNNKSSTDGIIGNETITIDTADLTTLTYKCTTHPDMSDQFSVGVAPQATQSFADTTLKVRLKMPKLEGATTPMQILQVRPNSNSTNKFDLQYTDGSSTPIPTGDQRVQFSQLDSMDVGSGSMNMDVFEVQVDSDLGKKIINVAQSIDGIDGALGLLDQPMSEMLLTFVGGVSDGLKYNVALRTIYEQKSIAEVAAAESDNVQSFVANIIVELKKLKMAGVKIKAEGANKIKIMAASTRLEAVSQNIVGNSDKFIKVLQAYQAPTDALKERHLLTFSGTPVDGTTYTMNGNDAQGATLAELIPRFVQEGMTQIGDATDTTVTVEVGLEGATFGPVTGGEVESATVEASSVSSTTKKLVDFSSTQLAMGHRVNLTVDDVVYSVTHFHSKADLLQKFKEAIGGTATVNGSKLEISQGDRPDGFTVSVTIDNDTSIF